MPQRGKALVVKPDNPNSMSQTHMIEKIDFC